MRKAYLEVVRIRGVQRDLVVNRILLLYMYWLKLYKSKNWVRVKKRRGKTEKKHWELAEFRVRSFCVGTLFWCWFWHWL